MSFIADIPIRLKLLLGFGAVFVCLALTNVLCIRALQEMKTSQENLFKTDKSTALDCMSFRNNTNRMRVAVLTMMLVTDEVAVEKLLKEIKVTTAENRSILEGLLQRFKDDAARSHQLEELQAAMNAFCTTRDTEIVPLTKAGKITEARDLVTGIQKPRFEKMRSIVQEMGDDALQQALQRMESASKGMESSIQLFSLIFCIATIAVAVVAWTLSHLIAKPLASLTVAARQIAQGDLASVVVPEHTRRDEVGILSEAFLEMTSSLRNLANAAERVTAGDLSVQIEVKSERDLLGNAFKSMVDNLAEVTSLIVEAVQILSESINENMAAVVQTTTATTETAAAVTETYTVVEELKQIAQLSQVKAQDVSSRARSSVEISASGRQSTVETIEGVRRIGRQMDAISEGMAQLELSNRSIVDIIATVDDLAQQSKILSINASIEAARAGESGRGFVTVSDEVSSMAVQSRQATAQVRSILNDIQQSTASATSASKQGRVVVESAVKQSGIAEQTIIQLADNLTESEKAAQQITISIDQHLIGVGQVLEAIIGIKGAMDQSVEAMHNMEEATARLQKLDDRLRELVSRYSLGSAHRSASTN